MSAEVFGIAATIAVFAVVLADPVLGAGYAVGLLAGLWWALLVEIERWTERDGVMDWLVAGIIVVPPALLWVWAYYR